MDSYKATNSKDFPGFLIVWCPRPDCRSHMNRPFVVHKETWLRPLKKVSRTKGHEVVITGRSCPYCFCPSHVPKRAEIR